MGERKSIGVKRSGLFRIRGACQRPLKQTLGKPSFRALHGQCVRPGELDKGRCLSLNSVFDFDSCVQDVDNIVFVSLFLEMVEEAQSVWVQMSREESREEEASDPLYAPFDDWSLDVVKKHLPPICDDKVQSRPSLFVFEADRLGKALRVPYAWSDSPIVSKCKLNFTSSSHLHQFAPYSDDLLFQFSTA